MVQSARQSGHHEAQYSEFLQFRRADQARPYQREFFPAQQTYLAPDKVQAQTRSTPQMHHRYSAIQDYDAGQLQNR